jgi:hypothetical protein
VQFVHWRNLLLGQRSLASWSIRKKNDRRLRVG